MKPVNNEGVTLIELVVVFVIIAVLAVLMVPNIGAWLPSYRLRSATRDLVSTMRTAQVKAVSNNIQYRVNLNSGDMGVNSYVLQYNTGGVWVNEGAVQSLPTGISIKANTFAGERADFSPNSTSSGGTVTLQSEKKKTQRSITVNPATGKVSTLD
jgi:type IV fimbrial biogenesis protein FimT